MRTLTFVQGISSLHHSIRSWEQQAQMCEPSTLHLFAFWLPDAAGAAIPLVGQLVIQHAFPAPGGAIPNGCCHRPVACGTAAACRAAAHQDYSPACCCPRGTPVGIRPGKLHPLHDKQCTITTQNLLPSASPPPISGQCCWQHWSCDSDAKCGALSGSCCNRAVSRW